MMKSPGEWDVSGCHGWLAHPCTGWQAASGTRFVLQLKGFTLRLLFVAYQTLISAAIAHADDRRVLLCDGTAFEGSMTTVGAAWNIVFETRGKARIVSAADVVRVGMPAEVPSRPLVVLADGGILVADVVSGDREKLTADSLLLGTITFPWDAVSAVVFHPPSDRRRLDSLLDRAMRGSDAFDRLLLANGDEVAGLVETIGGERLHVQAELGAVDVEIERIAAVLFRSPVRPASDPRRLRVWIGLRDGTRLPAVQLTINGPSMAITLAGGSTLRGQPENLVWLQPLGGQAVYLSDRKPSDYRHVPFLDLAWPYRMDRSVQNGWLRCDRQPYLKGLGVHSASRLTYLLAEPYRRFEADVGIDDETAGQGSVRFRVFIDGQQKYTSPIIRGGQKPLPVSVDLTGAKRLDLVVDFADRADQQDHADWLDARLIR